MADQAKNVLRISMDAKAGVKIGSFSRGGTSRVEIKASDHDFKPKVVLTPVGIFLPQFGHGSKTPRVRVTLLVPTPTE